MSLRFLRRAVALAIVLSAAVLRYWLLRARGPMGLERRALWLQDTCIRVLRSMGIRYEVEGEIPTRGLVVANHLSYLDIVILSAAMPCFFVGAPGRAHLLGGESPLHTRQGEVLAEQQGCLSRGGIWRKL
jgi:1-acyl-sn-glycerol-3-phosphate acyltransferase